MAWNGTVDVTKAGGSPTAGSLGAAELCRPDARPDIGCGTAASTPTLEPRGLDGPRSVAAADWPDEAGWAALREADDLEHLEPEREVGSDDGALELAFDLPMPSISLIELTPAG